ncbi:MAG TPA: type II toxin-antitoxin system VapC family toxin [Lacisediminihabitans sp.]|uniref:type II toxin-antitoxin system VapC family toxin n=1 Tax=Lacisediminihabitans sp. TaxID=2787631 RepID=UPI002ED9381A
MIVLDTNVLSEPLRAQPDPRVLGWFAALTEETTLTAISVGEILIGVRRLPEGRRRSGLTAAIDRLLASYADQVMPYDEPAARVYAGLQESRRAAGRPLSVEDGMIAAVCLHRGARLATRNVRDFDGLGVDLINPWE